MWLPAAQTSRTIEGRRGPWGTILRDWWTIPRTSRKRRSRLPTLLEIPDVYDFVWTFMWTQDPQRAITPH